MKLTKVFIFFILLCISFQICPGQEKPEAVLVDQFGRITCEELWARLDQFSNELSNNPDSTGYIVIYPEKASVRTGIGYINLIKGHWNFRKLDETRYLIIQGAERDAVNIEFWRVPPGADDSFYKGEKWIAAAVKVKKAFVFNSLHIEDVCPTFNPKDYAEILLSDPSLRGHIVFFNRSRRESRKEAQDWLTMLTKDYKVPRNRLKVFFATNGNGVETEFWIVPTVKK